MKKLFPFFFVIIIQMLQLGFSAERSFKLTKQRSKNNIFSNIKNDKGKASLGSQTASGVNLDTLINEYKKEQLRDSLKGSETGKYIKNSKMVNSLIKEKIEQSPGLSNKANSPLAASRKPNLLKLLQKKSQDLVLSGLSNEVRKDRGKEGPKEH